MTTIAARLREAIAFRKMRQAELAAASGVEITAISHYLRGDFNPKQENLRRLASALNVRAEWLMGLGGPVEPQSLPGSQSSVKMEDVELLEDVKANLEDAASLLDRGGDGVRAEACRCICRQIERLSALASRFRGNLPGPGE